MPPERPARPIQRLPLEFRGIVEDSAFRWRLKGVEVSRGIETLFVLSIDGLRHLLEIQLATAALQATIQGAAAPTRPPVKIVLPPQAGLLPDAAARAKLRAARRARRKGAG